MTSAEAAELVGLAKKHKVLLAPFHNRRWDSDFLTIQKLLHEGSLGRLVALESRFDRWRPARLTERLWKEDVDSGGMLQDLGPHLVDQALALFGKPEAVSAEVLRERDGAGPNDSFTIRLRYPDLIVTVASNLLSLPAGPRFHLRGTRGGYVKYGVDPQEAALTKITRIDDLAWGQEPSVRVGLVVCGYRRRDGQPSRSGGDRRLPALLRGHSRCAAGQGPRSGHGGGRLARGAAAGMGRGELRKAPRDCLRLEPGAEIEAEIEIALADHCRLGSLSISGTQKRKRAPPPGTLEASMPPPWTIRMARMMARPMPDPLRWPVRCFPR